jgi:hypothetical protein
MIDAYPFLKMFETAALGSATKFNVAEVLREAGPQVRFKSFETRCALFTACPHFRVSISVKLGRKLVQVPITLVSSHAPAQQ